MCWVSYYTLTSIVSSAVMSFNTLLSNSETWPLAKGDSHVVEGDVDECPKGPEIVN